MNDKLTEPSIIETLREFFPDLDSIPHADTISRVLARLNYSAHEIERAHINLLKRLIANKKFKKLLIYGNMPMSIDGTQKCVRNGQLQEQGWLLRTFVNGDSVKHQQYVYVLEANITFANGLSIPLMTEFSYLEDEAFNDDIQRQDCELKTFDRLADRLKKNFPRLKIVLLLDNLYANENVIKTVIDKKWNYLIKLPKKVASLSQRLETQRPNAVHIPGQSHYRGRDQKFYWVNHCNYHGMVVHLIGCREVWEEVDLETGEIIQQYSEHHWISSFSLDINNVHTVCNLASRKRGLIEDSFNTEKNRGYHYEHLFTYNWRGMQGFHLLMRLAHMINALSQFTRALKKYIKTMGISNTLDRIISTLFSPWISKLWVQQQLDNKSQLRFQFE